MKHKQQTWQQAGFKTDPDKSKGILAFKTFQKRQQEARDVASLMQRFFSGQITDESQIFAEVCTNCASTYQDLKREWVKCGKLLHLLTWTSQQRLGMVCLVTVVRFLAVPLFTNTTLTHSLTWLLSR